MRVEVDIIRVATRGNYTAHASSIQAFARAEFLRLIASAESRPVLRKTGSPVLPHDRLTGPARSAEPLGAREPWTQAPRSRRIGGDETHDA